MNSSHAMKSCVFILLVALLCAERAQGLRCYNCQEVTSEASCNIVICPYPDGVCVTHDVEATVGSQKVKTRSKYCLPTCPKSSNSLENILNMGAAFGNEISCCKKDLCNAAVPIGGRIWTVAGVLLCSLASVLLQILL